MRQVSHPPLDRRAQRDRELTHRRARAPHMIAGAGWASLSSVLSVVVRLVRAGVRIAGQSRCRPRRLGRPGGPCTFLAEVVAPRGGQLDVLLLENLFQSVCLSAREPVAFELLGLRQARRLLVRATTARSLAHLCAQLRAHLPQVEIRPLSPIAPESGHSIGDGGERSAAQDDPLRIGASESVRAVALRPRAGGHLPLKLYEQRELGAVGVDPLLGLLGAMDGLPPGGRVLAHLGLAAAPESWSRHLQRLAVEHPLAHERAREALRTRAGTGVFDPAGPTGATGPPLLPLLGLLGVLVAYQRWGALLLIWWRTRDIAHLARIGAIGIAALLLLAGVLVLHARLARRPVYDMRLVEGRTARIAARTSLVVVAIAPHAPATSGPATMAVADTVCQLDDVLVALVAAYRQHALASGNGFIPRRLSVRQTRHLASHWPRRALRSRFLLNARELAALWHLPAGDADVPLLERTRAKALLAPALPLASGYRVGVSAQAGHRVAVCLPAEALRHNAVLVAKTGKGKSSLLQHLARVALEQTTSGTMDGTTARRAGITARSGHAGSGERMGLVVVDPHGDLATSLLGLIPEGRRDDAVLVDLADIAYPVALNPLDALLGRDRDKAVESLLQILSQIWARFWGPRMQNALEYALKTLYEANEVLVAADPQNGPDQQFTLLDVAPVLSAPGFRRDVLALVRDQALHTWWTHYYKPLDPRLQLEIINPVLTKMAAFSGSRVARRIVGQGRSTINLADIVREGRVLLVNTAKGVVGAETATLVGATLLGALQVSLEEQARLAPEERRRFLVLVDEFQSILGVDYGAMLSELRKFGGTFALATQALAYLDALDTTLRPTVLANVDALYAFAASAEDARVLVRELDEALAVTDLINLDDFTCYAKMTLGGRRLPVFSLALDPPAPGDEQIARHVRGRARMRYARPLEAVEAALAGAAARYLPPHEVLDPSSSAHRHNLENQVLEPPAGVSARAPGDAPAAGDNGSGDRRPSPDRSGGVTGLSGSNVRGRRGRFGRRPPANQSLVRPAGVPLVETADLWADLSDDLALQSGSAQPIGPRADGNATSVVPEMGAATAQHGEDAQLECKLAEAEESEAGERV